MAVRPRIDLDGVTLENEEDASQIIAIFRQRTVEGLVLLVPESAEVLVPWPAIRGSTLDLGTGRLRIELDPAYGAKENWLRGSSVLVGTWMDRITLSRARS